MRVVLAHNSTNPLLTINHLIVYEPPSFKERHKSLEASCKRNLYRDQPIEKLLSYQWTNQNARWILINLPAGPDIHRTEQYCFFTASPALRSGYVCGPWMQCKWMTWCIMTISRQEH